MLLLLLPAFAKPAPVPAPAPAETFAFEPGGTRPLGAEALRALCTTPAPGTTWTVASCTPTAPTPGVKAAVDWCAATVAAANGTSVVVPTTVPTPADLAAAEAACVAVERGMTPEVAGVAAGVGLAGATGIDQATVLSGLSDFLVERAREELTVWLVARVGKQVCDDEPGSVALLPQSCALLGTDARLVTTTGIELLQEAARRDVRALPRRLAARAYAATPDGPRTQAQSRQRALALATAVLAREVELVLDGAEPLDALAAWSAGTAWDAAAWDPKWTDAGATPAQGTAAEWLAPALLHVASTVAAVLPTHDGAVGFSDGTRDARAVGAWTTAAALVDLQASGLDAARRDLGGPLPPTATAWASVHEVVDAVLLAGRRADELEAALAALPATATDAQRLALYVRYVALALEPVDAALGAADGLVTVDPASLVGAQAALALAGEVVDSARRVAEAAAGLDWTRAVSAALSFGQVVDPEPAAGGKKPGHKNALAGLRTSVRAASFAAGLAEAEDPADARRAIELIVAPVGGYGRKREAGAGVYVTLNSYVGAGGGVEVSWGAVEEADGTAECGARPAGAAFPMATLGLDLGGPVGGGWSLGAHVSALDLGGLAAARFDASDTEATRVNVTQVFAPGAWLVLGTSHAPFAFGLGAEATPALREDGSTGQPLNTVRVSAFVAMDLVLLP